MGGGESEIEESKRSSVDIDNILNPDEAPARRILCSEVTQRPPVVTRFGRVAKVGYLKNKMHFGVVDYPVSVGYLGKYIKRQCLSRVTIDRCTLTHSHSEIALLSDSDPNLERKLIEAL